MVLTLNVALASTVFGKSPCADMPFLLADVVLLYQLRSVCAYVWILKMATRLVNITKYRHNIILEVHGVLGARVVLCFLQNSVSNQVPASLSMGVSNIQRARHSYTLLTAVGVTTVVSSTINTTTSTTVVYIRYRILCCILNLLND